MSHTLALVQEAAQKRILILPHTQKQIRKRQIQTWEVEQAIWQGELIEDYPEDVRGHSCLLLGYGQNGLSLHVVCAPKEEFLSVITVYRPDPAKWTADFRRRRP